MALHRERAQVERAGDELVALADRYQCQDVGLALGQTRRQWRIRDGMGRSWDVSIPAPTPMHRKAINSVPDLYDLA